MKLDLSPIKPQALAVRIVSDAAPALAEALGLKTSAPTIGIITASSDDALFSALDQGTKESPADVVYAKSFYAGSSYPSGPLSGECIGIYAGATPAEVEAAIEGCLRYLENEAWFYAADEAGRLAFYPHVLASTGRFLAPQAQILVGEPMTYLIAPPAESIVGLDAALKAARVRMTKWFGPPSETNFGGGYLVGDQAACEAAARAFATAVVDVARRPRPGVHEARGAGESLAAVASRSEASTGARYRAVATGETFNEKPDHLTHLTGDDTLVAKTNPRIVLRGKVDLLQSALLDAQVAADAEHATALVGELSELLDLSRALVGAEVTGRALEPFRLFGMEPDEMRDATHKTLELYGVPFMYPDVRQGPVVARLNIARGVAREAELAALLAFARADDVTGTAPPTRADLCLALNRISSALYLLTTRYVGGLYEGARTQRGTVRGWRPPPAAS